MIKKFTVDIYVEEDDFCSLDLEEAIIDGIENIGNHTLKKIKVEE